jgi:hypothetical protein
MLAHKANAAKNQVRPGIDDRANPSTAQSFHLNRMDGEAGNQPYSPAALNAI